MSKRMELAVCALALAAGIAATKAQAQEPLRFSWWGGEDRKAATLELIKAFEAANPGVTITGESSAFDGYYERIKAAIDKGDEPDIMQLNWAWLFDFSKDGDRFININNERKFIKQELFNKNDLALTSINGKLNALPFGMATRVFIYNVETWKNAGIDYPRTWDDLFAAAAAMRTRLGDNYSPLVLNRTTWLTLSHAWATQKFGTTFINATAPKINYSRAEVVQWMAMLREIGERGVAPSVKTFAAATGGPEREPQDGPQWARGEWAGDYTWDSTIPLRASVLPGKAEQLVVGPMITLPDARTSGALSRPAMVFAISKHAKSPDIAAKFLNFLMTTPEAARIEKMWRSLPTTETQLLTLVNDGLISEQMTAGIDQISELREHAMIPQASPWFENGKVADVLIAAEDAIFAGTTTPQAAADDIMTKVGAILAGL